LNRLSDERLKLAQETLAGIRLIKYFAWESVFAARIQKVREAELGRVRLILLMTAISNGLVYWLPVFGGAAIVAVHAWRLDGQIDSGLVYSIIMMMSNLVTPIYMVPAFSAALVAAKAASRRLEEYFEAAEAKPLPSDDSGSAVHMADAEFVWETLPPSELGKKKRHKKKGAACADPTQTTLTCSSPFARTGPFNLSIPHGSFTVIVGPVGSGKSSFLAALTGEMKHASGTAALNAGSIAYCPQQAWIMSGTVKENILFGREYDAKRYAQALRESCLGPDMALLAHGDATKLGEGGAGLSGGQKQRLSLARALYAAPQLYLLDDPLSAVDPHVAKKLLLGCFIGGLMKGTTRILVTHHVGLLSDLPSGAVDRLLVMDECKGTYFGPFDKSKLSAMAIEGHAHSPDSPPPSGLVVEADPELGSTPVNDTSAPKEDESMQASVLPFYSGKNKAWLYLTAAGLLWSLILVGGLLVSVELVRIARDLYFRAHVLSSTAESGPALHRTMLVYTGLGLLQGLLTCTTGVAYGCVASVRAVRKMHNAALLAVMQASVAFFDQVQLGGLLERFGGDLMTVDTVFPERALQVLAVIGSIGSAIALLAIGIVMSSANAAALVQFLGILALGLLPIIAVIVWSWYMFTNGWSPIQQIIGRNAGALTAAFTEALSGLPTLRAFNARALFEQRGQQRIDALGKCLILAVAMRRWVSTRIDFASGLLVLLTMSIAVNRRLDPGLAGLLLAYALQAAYILEWCIKQIAEVESALNAFDRIASLALTLEPEATLSTASTVMVEPPTAWPASGSINISDLFLRYRPELPLTLKGLSLSIESGQKVALVGRTGAGKSSLIAALFRIARPDAGSIAIDGLDIASVPLSTLRHRLAIVPQDPVLFSGTLLFNLDPESAYTDAQLWAVLEATRMAKDIAAHPLRLEAPVDEAGANFSIGQRQLLCLARALLRPAPVLLIDEATANVDFETDARIQAVLRQHVRDTGTTLVTVAHRIATVMDYDRVAVLGDGQLLEVGAPQELLAKPDGAFRAMAIKAGII
jgi:ABC-type multidrug transport system fused ATPase/permease subunit